jgi:hypothetical protein
MRVGIWVMAALLPLTVGACGTEEPWEFEGCDQIDPSMCSLPWPSSYHVRVDETTETGWKVALKGELLPANSGGGLIDPALWNERDGFSIGTPMLAGFGQLDVANLPGHSSIERSLADDSPTLLIDTSTGERVAHWVEVDAHAENPAERMTILWPAKALEFNRRYVVAFRDLRAEDGGAVAPSPGFLTLREGKRSDDPNLERRRRHYRDEVFPLLDEQGWNTEDVILAWDFHTASRGSTLGRAEFAVANALAGLPAEGPGYRWLGVEENDCSDPSQTTWKVLEGRFKVPQYTVKPGIDTLLNRGTDGMPFASGEREPSFIARIPCSLKNEPGPAFLLQYGHGLLGSEEEARTGWLGRFIHEHRMVVVAAQFTGMATEDYPAIGLMLANDLSRFPTIPERSTQGFVEQALLTQLALRGLTNDDHFIVNGVPLLVDDPEQRGWYGISQGGILGGSVVALNPALQRGVLGVGGGPYPLLLPRSVDFTDFFRILASRYPNQRDQMFLIEAMLIHLWDNGESAGWSHDLAANKQLLLQIAHGDAQVHVEGSRWQARSVGARMISPETRPVWGIGTEAAPFSGSGYVEYDYGVPEPPITNLPPDKAYDTHECVRRTGPAQLQVVKFLKEGVIENFCDGPCVFTVEEGC